MSNICDNTLYVNSKDSKNLETVENFFKNWHNADLERDNNTIDCYFESRWTFPEAEMNKLYNEIPNKDDIYMRCLSVEYGNLYHALWICDKNGWKEV